MIGKASEIKTWCVHETQYKTIGEILNTALDNMGENIILDIKYSSTLVGQRYWGSALIIYKEVTQ